MPIRYMKILLVLTVALLGAIAFLTNVSTLKLNYGTVQLILSMQETFGWPNTAWRAINHPYLVAAVYAVIVLCELAVAVFCITGAVKMWQHRKHPAADFNVAKDLALVGCTIGILLWFTGFVIIAGEWFLMWQHRAETLAHAFRFSAGIALIMLIVNSPDR